MAVMIDEERMPALETADGELVEDLESDSDEELRTIEERHFDRCHVFADNSQWTNRGRVNDTVCVARFVRRLDEQTRHVERLRLLAVDPPRAVVSVAAIAEHTSHSTDNQISVSQVAVDDLSHDGIECGSAVGHGDWYGMIEVVPVCRDGRPTRLCNLRFIWTLRHFGKIRKANRVHHPRLPEGIFRLNSPLILARNMWDLQRLKGTFRVEAVGGRFVDAAAAGPSEETGWIRMHVHTPPEHSPDMAQGRGALKQTTRMRTRIRVDGKLVYSHTEHSAIRRPDQRPDEEMHTAANGRDKDTELFVRGCAMWAEDAELRIEVTLYGMGRDFRETVFHPLSAGHQQLIHAHRATQPTDYFVAQDGNSNEWRRIYFHRSMLMQVSLVFRRMFEQDTSERKTGKVAIIDCSASVMEAMVKLIYGETLSADNVVEGMDLVGVMHKYDLPRELFDTAQHLTLEKIKLKDARKFWYRAKILDANIIRHHIVWMVRQNYNAYVDGDHLVKDATNYDDLPKDAVHRRELVCEWLKAIGGPDQDYPEIACSDGRELIVMPDAEQLFKEHMSGADGEWIQRLRFLSH